MTYNKNGIIPKHDRYIPAIFPEKATVADYFPENSVVAFLDFKKCEKAMESFEFRISEDIKSMAEEGVSQADLMKAQIFWVKDKFIARAWGGYTSTKRTGNEAGDSIEGVGGSDPSKGYAGI